MDDGFDGALLNQAVHFAHQFRGTHRFGQVGIGAGIRAFPLGIETGIGG